MRYLRTGLTLLTATFILLGVIPGTVATGSVAQLGSSRDAAGISAPESRQIGVWPRRPSPPHDHPGTAGDHMRALPGDPSAGIG